jgi:urease accessory protein
LIWCDALRLEGDIGGELAHPMRFGGARAYGTLIYMGTDAAAMLDLVRGQIDGCSESAATRIANLVIVRFLSASTSRLRQAYGGLWARLRARAAGLPAHLPRIWAI